VGTTNTYANGNEEQPEGFAEKFSKNNMVEQLQNSQENTSVRNVLF